MKKVDLDLKATPFEYYQRNTGEYIIINDFHISEDGIVYRYREKKGEWSWYEIDCYKNVVNKSGYEYLRFHVKINEKSYPFLLHNAIGQIYVPGYERGLVCDHIDRNTLNNELSNLQWISRGDNSIKGWNQMTKIARTNRIKSYSEGVKKAHANGRYDEHLRKLHKSRKSKNTK